MADPLNILFLMTDQHRADHVGWAPDSRLDTPNLNRLAEGTAFTNCLSVNPICTPARTALITGRYTHQIGTLSMSGDLSREHPTFFRALQNSGYWTSGIGKFHWMQNWPWGVPHGQGHDLIALEDEVKKYGLDDAWEVSGKQLAQRNHCRFTERLAKKGLLEAYRQHTESRGGNTKVAEETQFTGEPWPFEECDYVDIVTADAALEHLEARPKDQPFCSFVSFCSPHPPFDPPSRWLESVDPNDTHDILVGDATLSTQATERMRRLQRAYKAMIKLVDDQVGRLMDYLEREDLLKNTLVVFTSDHGEMLGDLGCMQKQHPWAGSVGVPAVVRHPDHLDGRRFAGPIECIDLTATMLDAAGLDPTEALSRSWPAFGDRIPARSLMPVVRGEADSVREFAFSECRGAWQLIQSERWKYVRWLGQGEIDAPREELFDLKKDPNEQVDVAGRPEHAEALEWCRRRREHVMDTTPPAQTGWAPYGGAAGS